MNSSGDRYPIRDRTLVLRVLVPGLETRLRDKMKDMEEAGRDKASSNSNANNAANTQKDGVFLDLDGVACEPTSSGLKSGTGGSTLWNFHCDGAVYPARLVNLPAPIELHKTHDHAMYYKCTDIAQMLIVYEDAIALEESMIEEERKDEAFTSSTGGAPATGRDASGFSSYFPSGLTPPLRRVVERRYEQREHPSRAPAPRSVIADVEEEMLQLMGKIAKPEDNVKKKGERESKEQQRQKIPTLTSASKVLEEISEDIVDYEPWMDDYGRQPHGIEFSLDDQIASLHPEIWLPPDTIALIKQAEIDELKRKQDILDKKEAKRREKQLQKEAVEAEQQALRLEKEQQRKKKESTMVGSAAAATGGKKKGIASRKNTAKAAVAAAATGPATATNMMDDVTHAASQMLNSELELDLENDDGTRFCCAGLSHLRHRLTILNSFFSREMQTYFLI
jgi:transcription initiation factor TFIID subunit 7